MINWAKYFDKIYCILEIQDKTKKELIEKELKRVGILDSGIFEWYFRYNHNTDNAFYNYLEDIATKKQHTDFCTNTNHFKVLQLAQYWQYKKVLILEDNIRFLKDLNKIEQILEHKPEDADLILYDKIIAEQNNKVDLNEYYEKFTSLNSTACYEVSNKGIDKLKELLETNLEINLDQYFNNTLLYLQNLNCYCSKTNLAIQVNFNKKHYQYPTSIIQSQDYNLYNNEAPVYKDKIDEQLIQQYSDEVYLTKSKKINIKDPITPIQMNICIAITIDVAEKIYPLLYSLLKYSESKFNVYIMTDQDEIKEEHYNLFKPFQNERMNIQLLDCKLLDQNISEVKKNYHLTKMSWARLLIPTLFSHLDRILYLDYDTVIINKGIEWLYNLDFKDNYLAATRDGIYHFSSIKYNDFIMEREIFEKVTDNYVQAGVTLYNIKKIIEDGKAEGFKELLKVDFDSTNLDILTKISNKINMFNIINNKNIKVVTFKFYDQSYLNYYFANKILETNYIFNNYLVNDSCSNTIIFKEQLNENWKFENQQQLVNKTVILHFACNKPWNESTSFNYFQTKYQKQLIEKYKHLKQETDQYLKNYHD